MSLSLVTAPTIEPITLAEAKLHLRVDVDDENALIQDLIVSARQHAETVTHRALLQQTWDLKLDAFPCGPIVLPLPPLASVTSVTYLDTAGASQTWSSSDYDVDPQASGPQPKPARITPAYGEVYPSTYAAINAVTVRFVAGYGTAREAVPSRIRSGIKFLVELEYARGHGRDVAESETDIDNRFFWEFIAF